MRVRTVILILLLASGAFSRAIAADDQAIQTSGLSGADLKSIGIVQHLGREIPRNLIFTDSTGQRVNFSDLVGHKPTLLALVYYDCPNLCTLVLNATVSSVADLRRTVGDGFQVVVVSIDPTETPALAAQKKAAYLLRYSRGHDQDKEWSFLVGDEANIHQLADAVGYRYRYDPTIHQFAHGSGIVMLDGQGRIVKYFLGIEYPPTEIEKAIQYAQSGQVGTPSPNFLLLCYCYNPLTGPYGFLIFTLLKIGAFVTVASLVAFIVRSIRREAHKEAI
jgi:protein SCO1/2